MSQEINPLAPVLPPLGHIIHTINTLASGRYGSKFKRIIRQPRSRYKDLSGYSKAPLMISQHWFRQWLDALGHYLSQCCNTTAIDTSLYLQSICNWNVYENVDTMTIKIKCSHIAVILYFLTWISTILNIYYMHLFCVSWTNDHTWGRISTTLILVKCMSKGNTIWFWFHSFPHHSV